MANKVNPLIFAELDKVFFAWYNTTMKKDIFNGKVRPEYTGFVKGSIIFACIFFIGSAIFFLLFAIFYDNIEYDGQICLFVVSALCVLLGILYPLLSILFIRKYPKNKKLAKLFIKEYVLIDIADIENN